jgi:hypothetical protein
VLLALQGSCQPSAEQLHPEASLAASREAQVEFRRLHELWVQSTSRDRGKLAAQLASFLDRFPDDDRARVVSVYLALVHVERGQLASARTALAEADRGPRGSSYDLAQVAEAGILIRQGRPEAALARLEPLSGKIVDSSERYVFGEQIVAASLAARRFRAAVDHTIVWLAHARSEDVESAEAAARHMLRGMPTAAMEQRLQFLDAESDNEFQASGLAAARDWLRKFFRDELVRRATKARDGALARRLLDASPALRRSEAGAELSRLASSEGALPRVAGRSLGLVLSQGDAELRRRSAQVGAGAARALGLPGSAGKPGSVALLAQDQGSSSDAVESALGALAGEGAAILIAGVDRSHAERAARYAEANAIPVILLSPVATRQSGFAFVLGSEPQAAEAELLDALRARRVSAPIKIGPGGVPCTPVNALAAEPRFPLHEWRSQPRLGLLLVGNADCARDALEEVGRAGLRPSVAFGLECAELATRFATKYSTVVAAAGEFPRIGAASGEDASGAPSWYEALGHDAALLAAAALRGFSAQGVDDARAVAALHARARDQLGRVRVELWSSEHAGFAGGQVLQRTFKAISWADAEPRSAR